MLLFARSPLGFILPLLFLLGSVFTSEDGDHSIRADWQMNHFAKLIDNLVDDEHDKSESNVRLLRSIVLPAPIYRTSLYQVIPGSYQMADNAYFPGTGGTYSASTIYAKYLATGAYQYHSQQCVNHYGQVPQLTKQDMDNAFGYANHQIVALYPEYMNQSQYSIDEYKEIQGQMMGLVSEYFAKYKCMSKYQLATYLPAMSIDKQYQTMNARGDVACTPYYDRNYDCAQKYASKYRTIDGSCNNRNWPYWGRSNICHVRLLPPDYSDGVQGFRMSKYAKPLPNPRDISNYATPTRDLQGYYTGLLLGWGQFINHDLSNTANYKKIPSNDLNCCLKPDSKCAAIKIGGDRKDYMTAKQNKNCINFIRSSPCPLCKLGPRQQLNSQTSFLDGSQVYGSTDKQAASLRAFRNGMLRITLNRNGQPILPTADNAKPCLPMKKGLKCFVAGDSRVNQHPILLAMHTAMLINHNIHALKLKQINPQWNDEKTYQEARRITIAEIQHVTYNEYLPIIMGSLLANYYSLLPLEHGYTRYEPNTDPSSWNEFSTAASRYGHSQIKDYYKLLTPGYGNASHFLLKDNFFEPGLAYDSLHDDLFRGITSEPSNTVDPYYSLTAKNFIMRQKSKTFGIDLVSINVLRGRDHGIPGYVHYLKACFNFEAKSWKDLEKFIPKETLVNLQALYRNIEDVDLYVGGVSERHYIDASIGPTFGCLVGIQFYHIKFGDRYFYEHGNQHGSFTPAQLINIRHSATMARILCRVSPTLRKIQPKPFYLPSGYNPLTECSKLPDIDYLLWKDNRAY